RFIWLSGSAGSLDDVRNSVRAMLRTKGSGNLLGGGLRAFSYLHLVNSFKKRVGTARHARLSRNCSDFLTVARRGFRRWILSSEKHRTSDYARRDSNWSHCSPARRWSHSVLRSL